MRDPAGVPALWRRLATHHRDLSGLTVRARRTDDPGGNAGVYRVVAAGFAGKGEARAARGRLRAEGQGCVVVAPQVPAREAPRRVDATPSPEVPAGEVEGTSRGGTPP